MPDYKSMYFKLFNRVTDVINYLQEAQLESENICIESDDAQITDITEKQAVDKIDE